MHFLRTNSPVAVFVLLLIMALVLAPVRRLNAADHGDAPLTAHDIGADLNDVYMFLDPNDNSRLILIMTVHGFIVPGENANFGIFDPARLRPDYVPTGFKGIDGRQRSIPGHPFGLTVSAQERKDLIAFLKTL